MESMDQCGPDLWDLSTVQVLKQTLQRELSSSISSALDGLDSPTASEDTAKSDPEGNGQQSEETKSAENGTEPNKERSTDDSSEEHRRDRKIQLFFDTVYLKYVLAAKDLEHNQLTDVAERIQSGLGSSKEQVAKPMEKATHEYWKRTRLLFGLLAVGEE